MKNQKRKYFDFTLNTEEKQERTVCFSPEKHTLVNRIFQQHSGCEIKKFKRSDSNDVLITDFSSVRQFTPDFEKPTHELVYKNIEAISNECPLYNIVNVVGIIFDIGPIQTCEKDGKPLKFRKATISDDTGTVPITLFSDISEKSLKDKQCYAFTNMRIAKYLSQRLLKSTQFTTVDLEDRKRVKLGDKDLIDHSKTSVVGIIASVDMKSFQTKYVCINCKHSLDASNEDEGMITCGNCDNMLLMDQCKVLSKVCFTLLTDHNEKIKYDCNHEILEDCFSIPIKKRALLAKTMLQSRVITRYDTSDNSLVSITLEEDEKEKVENVVQTSEEKHEDELLQQSD